MQAVRNRRTSRLFVRIQERRTALQAQQARVSGKAAATDARIGGRVLN